MSAPGLKDFRPVKAAFRRALPPGHPLREQVLAEPDALPAQAWVDRAVIYCAMLVRATGA